MKLLKLSILFVLFTLSFSCQDDSSEEDKTIPTEGGEPSLTIEKEILNLVNKYRKIKKLAILKPSTYASELCKKHNDYMIARQQISHDKFQERYEKLRVEVKANSAAENVASGYTTAEQVVNAWLQSKGHKKNIEGNFTHMGVNAKKDNNGTYFYTQIFYR